MKKVRCPYCKECFLTRGTRIYCPGKDCYTKSKKDRQRIVDGLAKEIKKGLYTNFKFFQEHLPENGQTKIDYDQALKSGFNEDAYYGTYKFGNKLWRMVENYYFLIEHTDDKRILNIYKK
jgi:hypothetical protein